MKLLSEVIRAMSSAYMYLFDLVCGRSAVYILKRRGASTDPWGTPFFKNLRLLFSSLTYNTKLHDEIIFIMKLTSELSGITFKSCKLSPLCQIVSYAAERSMSTTPHFSFRLNPAYMVSYLVSSATALYKSGLFMWKVGLY